jgi:hypothetical protein
MLNLKKSERRTSFAFYLCTALAEVSSLGSHQSTHVERSSKQSSKRNVLKKGRETHRSEARVGKTLGMSNTPKRVVTVDPERPPWEVIHEGLLDSRSRYFALVDAQLLHA